MTAAIRVRMMQRFRHVSHPRRTGARQDGRSAQSDDPAQLRAYPTRPDRQSFSAAVVLNANWHWCALHNWTSAQDGWTRIV